MRSTSGRTTNLCRSQSNGTAYRTSSHTSVPPFRGSNLCAWIQSRYGPRDLFIHKMVWRFPLGDFAAPSNGKTADAQPVIDDCASVHFNRLPRDGPKTQPWRCNRIEIGCVRKKGKYLFNWPGQPDFAAELVNVHRLIRLSCAACCSNESVRTLRVKDGVLLTRQILSAHVENDRFVCCGNGGCFRRRFRQGTSPNLEFRESVLGIRVRYPRYRRL